MSKLNELDKSILELEEQIVILKSNNEILSKITAIKSSLDLCLVQTTKNNEELSDLVVNIKSELENFSSEIKDLKQINENFINDLVSSNKKLIRELEEAILSKLDRLSSEIQNALRTEVNQLEKSVKLEISERFIQLNDNQKFLFKEQETNTKQLFELNSKSIKNLIYILLAISALSLFARLI
jgi:hypothetical protein